jgi:hypothetical protein
MSSNNSGVDVLTTEMETDDGTVYVAYNERDLGSMEPFYVAYTDPDRTERYGYACGSCGSLAVSMDAMGRVECTDCANSRKPSQWDAAYL